jgi:hypothetical protein
MTPYEQFMAALKHGGFLRGGKTHCPTCPPQKRRGFDVTEATTAGGGPTVVVKCFRGCDTLSDIVPALGLDPADLFGGGSQEMLFKTDRYCRITTQGFKALPKSSVRTFGIAASIGYYPSTRSAFTLLRSPGQWDAVLREAEITERQLRWQVDVWIRRDMAHRCQPRGVLVLYRGPLERCPNCGRLTQSIPSRGHTTTRKYAQKGSNVTVRRHGSDTTHQKEAMSPLGGSNIAVTNALPWENQFPEGDGAPIRRAVK